MKKLNLVLSFLWLMTAYACQPQLTESQQRVLSDRLLKLQGVWSTPGSNGYVEVWKTGTDTLLKGAGYLMMNDTLRLAEKLAILSNEGNLEYQTLVFGQNNESVITFPLYSHTDSSMIFFNKKHDFPNIIAYYFRSDTTLHVEIKSLIDPTRDYALNLKKQKRQPSW